MPSVLAYHRPESLDEALSLLAGTNRRVVGGGTVVVPESRVPTDEGVELVDLQALGLAGIEPLDGRLRLGAMTRLQDLVDDERVPTLLRDLARRELPSALRAAATVGGTVALGSYESVLLGGLLVHDAAIELDGDEVAPIASIVSAGVGGRIITAVVIETAGTGAIASTARTPADEPIVAAIARRTEGGTSVALTGVAGTPVLVDPADPTAALTPPSDFRGSSDYRLHLAAVLTTRAMAEVAA